MYTIIYVIEHVRKTASPPWVGFNTLLFAYGQTGTGKTHTFMGPPDSLHTVNHPDWGLFPPGLLTQGVPGVPSDPLDCTPFRAFCVTLDSL
jgi:hypothetical protein